MSHDPSYLARLSAGRQNEAYETKPQIKDRDLAILIIVATGFMLVFLHTLSDGRSISVDRSGQKSVQNEGPSGFSAIAKLLAKLDIPTVRYTDILDRNGMREGVVVVPADDAQYVSEAYVRFEHAKSLLFIFDAAPSTSLVDDTTREQQSDIDSSILRELASDITYRLSVADDVQAWKLPNEISDPPALIEAKTAISTQLSPVVARGDHILLAEIPSSDLPEADFETDGPRVFVLFDSGPLLNVGLIDGERQNAIFAIQLLAYLSGGNGPVVFDETAKRFGLRQPLFWAALLRLPLGAVSVTLLALCIVVLVRARAQFGRVYGARLGLASGKELLLQSSARILRRGEASRALVERYLQDTMTLVARRRSVSQIGNLRVLAAKIDARSAGRASQPSSSDTSATSLVEVVTSYSTQQMDPQDAIELAQTIQAWRRIQLNER